MPQRYPVSAGSDAGRCAGILSSDSHRRSTGLCSETSMTYLAGGEISNWPGSSWVWRNSAGQPIRPRVSGGLHVGRNPGQAGVQRAATRRR